MFANQRSQVLITGGTSGIGLGLAKRFLASGASVLVTGRDGVRPAEAEVTNPNLRGVRSDIGSVSDRETLARHVMETMPGLNVVINNSGIQRRVALADDQAPWVERQTEIDVLLSGPVHLNTLLLPGLLARGCPCLVVNVTSGGAYVPQPFAPIYAACKAALHSYTVTLRHSLRGTEVRVIELIPPAVATGLAGPGRNHGASIDQFCDTVFPQVVEGNEAEIGYGPTATDEFHDARQPFREMFEASAVRFQVRGYRDRDIAQGRRGSSGVF